MTNVCAFWVGEPPALAWDSDVVLLRSAPAALRSIRDTVAAPPAGAGPRLGILFKVPTEAASDIVPVVQAGVEKEYPGAAVKFGPGSSNLAFICDETWVRVLIPAASVPEAARG